jgi:hypothetical protein
MKGGKSSLAGLMGGLLIGKMGGFDEVPGLGVVVMEVDGKLAFIGGDTCLLLERSVTLLTLLAAFVVSPKLFLLGLPGQWRSISGSEIGIA